MYAFRPTPFKNRPPLTMLAGSRGCKVTCNHLVISAIVKLNLDRVAAILEVFNGHAHATGDANLARLIRTSRVGHVGRRTLGGI